MQIFCFCFLSLGIPSCIHTWLNQFSHLYWEAMASAIAFHRRALLSQEVHWNTVFLLWRKVIIYYTISWIYTTPWWCFNLFVSLPALCEHLCFGSSTERSTCTVWLVLFEDRPEPPFVWIYMLLQIFEHTYIFRQGLEWFNICVSLESSLWICKCTSKNALCLYRLLNRKVGKWFILQELLSCIRY